MIKEKTLKAILLVLLVLPALCLAAAPALAEEEDFSAIEGDWFTEEIMMTVTDDGHFVLGWNDGDWTGSLKPERRVNEDGDEYIAYRMILEDPKDAAERNPEFVSDPYHPGKLLYYQDGIALDVFCNAPVWAMDISEEEDLSEYEPCTYVDLSRGEEQAATILFTFLRPVKEVEVLSLYDQEIDEYGELGFRSKPLARWEQIDSGFCIVVKYVFEGDLPELAITFLTEDNIGYTLSVEISGEDGAIDLLPQSSG